MNFVPDVMKFHHLGQHLLDTNCLLLILKMFGLQEVSVSVASKADASENKSAQRTSGDAPSIDTLHSSSFFQFCQLHFSQNPPAMRPEDHMLKPPRHAVVKTTILPNGQKHEEEMDLLTDFSWRNFFATINFAKIMQKLSKHRSHRIRMMVQYKSSVSTFLISELW